MVQPGLYAAKHPRQLSGSLAAMQPGTPGGSVAAAAAAAYCISTSAQNVEPAAFFCCSCLVLRYTAPL